MNSFIKVKPTKHLQISIFPAGAFHFTHLFKDNIEKDTPPGYTYEEFKKIAYQNKASAEIYECEGRLLVPFSTFLAEYRDTTHPIYHMQHSTDRKNNQTDKQESIRFCQRVSMPN